MVSSGTLHVVSTEMTVGAFAMAGAAFLLAGLASHGLAGMRRHLTLADHVAHFALAFGLLAMPMAIVTGIQASPGEGVDHPLLINKMLLASTAFGLAFGVLLTRWRQGTAVWQDAWGRRWQALGGMASVGLILTTASIGGTFSRGESLLDMLHLPYEHVPLMPFWLSGLIIAVASANLVLLRRPAQG
jgi:hypothetical protein